MIAGVFEVPAWVLAWFYSFTHNYAIAIALIAVLVMILVTPLNLKSTKGMLEMQRLAPEMRKLQAEHRGDRQKLNEEMMKLYQEHKVNPMASCLPLVAQMPVFIIMFRILHGLTYDPVGGNQLVAEAVLRAGSARQPRSGRLPPPLSRRSTPSCTSRSCAATEMKSFGLDLAMSPAEVLGDDFAQGLDLRRRWSCSSAGLYFFQQRMVAARAAVSPTMSPGQQKLMQYLPVVFAIFQIFFLLGLVIYYIVQSILRILQQVLHHEALLRSRRGARPPGAAGRGAGPRDRQAGRWSGGGMLAQARRDLADSKTKGTTSKQSAEASRPVASRPAARPRRMGPPRPARATRVGRPRPRAGRRRPIDLLQRGPVAIVPRAARSVDPHNDRSSRHGMGGDDG